MNRCVHIAVALIALATLAVGATWAVDLTDGLVGLWPFNDGAGVVARDSSGLGNHGTVLGSAFFTTDPQMGGVLQVDGVSGSVVVPHNASLEPATGTIMVWVKPARVQTADLVSKNTDYLVRRNQVYTIYAYCLRISKNGAPVALLTSDDPSAEYAWTYLEGPKGQVKAGQWSHLAMRWDGSSLSLFVNGKLVAAKSYSAIPNSGLSYAGNLDLKVAAAIWDFDDGWLEFTGQLAGLRFFGRALSEAEINAAYSSSAPAQAKGSAKR